MTDVIGQSTIKVVADASELKAGMAGASRAVADFEKAAASSAKSAASAIGNSMVQAEGAVERYTTAQRRFIASAQTTSMRVGTPSASAFFEERAALLGVQKETANYIARIKESEKVTVNYGMSVKQTAAAMRLMPAQITDIVTSLAGGQPAYLVAIQQGGQLKDSFGGIGAAGKALLSVFTPLRLIIGAAGLAATAAATAFYQGSREASQLREALIETGNAAGFTAGRLQNMAAEVATLGGTQGQAAEAIQALVATGRLGGETLQTLAQATVSMQRATGKSAEDMAKQFAAIAADPVKAVAELNHRYNFLNMAVYEQIRLLAEQGRTAEASNLALKTFAQSQDTAGNKIIEQQGYIQSALRVTTGVAKGMWDSLLGIGRPSTDEDALKKLQDVRGRREVGSYSSSSFINSFGQRANDQAERTMQARVDAANAEAQAKKTTADNTNAAIKAEAEIVRLRDGSLSKQQQLNKALREYRTDLEAIRKVNPGSTRLDPKEISMVEANLREKFKETAVKARANEGERYLDSLQKQMVALNGVTAEEEAALTIERLRTEENVKISGKLEERILKQARLLDAFKDEKAMLELIYGSLQRNNDLVIKEAREWKNAQAAAAEYLATMQRGFDRDISARASSRNEQERAAGISQIEERYAQQLLQLRAEERLNPDKDHTQELNLLQRSRDDALRIYDRYYAARRAQDADAGLGLQVATRNYIEDAQNNFQLFGQAATGIFQGMEDAFTKFAQTGKVNIKDFAGTVVAEISRIASKKIVLSFVTDSSGSMPAGWINMLASLFGAGGNTGFGTGSNFGNQDYASSFATGTNYVPYDGFRATLHQGEAVVPKEFNPAAGGEAMSGDTIIINVQGVKDEGGLRRTSSQIAAKAAFAVSHSRRVR